MGNRYLADVLAQSSDLRAALALYVSDISAGALSKLPKRIDHVLFTGMGSSHVCSQAAVIHLAQRGIPARLESASEILHYELGGIAENALLVLISQSGESGEIVRLVEQLPASQHIVGITNDPQSTLGRRADTLLLMHVQPEEAVSTRTYLASLMLCAVLAAAIAGDEPLTVLRGGVPKSLDALEEALNILEAQTDALRDFIGLPQYLCVIGRGGARGTARAGALFIRECAKYPALDFDSGEFRHGPFEMVDKGFHALLFAPGDQTYALHQALAEDIARLGGKVVYVTDQAADFANENIFVLQFPLPEALLSPVVEIAAAQWVANNLAEARGFPVGVFRQSNKVTRE